MSAEAYTDWLSPGSLAWTLLRVCTVWLALHGAGSLLLRIGAFKDRFALLPKAVAGMIPYTALLPVLSVSGLLSRTSVAVALVAGAVPGVVLAYMHISTMRFADYLRRKDILLAVPFLLALLIATTDLMLAGRPELDFNDTQVTYLVHPDRWLNEGSLGFIDETTFSAFPLTSELLLALPSSLASDRMDQLILGQVFCMSMLLMLVPLSIRLLGLSWRWLAAAWISVAGTATLVLWCHFAKPDAIAVFLVTLALAILLRQMHMGGERGDLSAFLVMGMALATKYTVYVALAPFLVMAGWIWKKEEARMSTVLGRLLLMGVIPGIYAVRTALLTGSPFYPHAEPFDFLLQSRWRMPNIELTYNVFNDRSSHFFPSVGFFENIYHYFGVWNSSIFLMAAGYVSTLKSGRTRQSSLILAGVLVYAALCILLFYPAWWGAKYGILLIPFAALWGLYMLSIRGRGLLWATLIAVAVYFVYESPLSPTERWGLRFRREIARSYLTEVWSGPVLDCVERQPELAATMWMNAHLPDNSTVLSLYYTKRYFSRHRWLNAWRYPPAAGIYLENSLEEEIAILESLDVDFLVFKENDPAPFDDEDSVELLCRIGRGDLLEPVASLNGVTVARFSPENLGR